MFYYPKFTRKLKKAGLTSVTLSVNGPTAKIHDSITNVKGSFDYLIRGIKNLQKEQVNLNASIVVIKQNYKYLVEIVKLLDKFNIYNIEFQSFIPYSEVISKFDIIPKYTEVIKKLIKLNDYSDKKNITIRDIPKCIIPREFSEMSVNGIHNKDNNNYVGCPMKQKISVCNNCKMNELCDGIYKNYLKKHGKEEFKPLK